MNAHFSDSLQVEIKVRAIVIECRKTKTKVITSANHNRREQHNEPIRPQLFSG